jgi:phosphoglycerate dehydrogenase-like enzyme
LRWIHTISIGVNHVLFPFLVTSDIVLTNARGVYDTSVAEMVMAYMLTVVKELPAFRNLQVEHRWQKVFLQELDGRTVGIVGFGGIGQRVAQLARPFGVRIVATRRRPECGSQLADQILPHDRLHELMAQSDFVVVALPLTDCTYHLIDARVLAHAKPGAWLINVARGAIVDEPALVRALQKGQLGGACLDVFEEEPLPENSPLWDLPNVIITPHTSGLSPQLYERSADLFLTNLSRYVAGEPLLNVVDKALGY